MSIVPENCPTCGSVLEWSATGVDLFCKNINCEAKVGRKLLHFFSSLDNLDGFGPATIETLIEHGTDTIPQIYELEVGDFIDFGFGPIQSENLYYELQQSKVRDLPDFKFIASLGIPNLGRGGAKKLLGEHTLEDILFNNGIQDTMLVDGFAFEKSESIHEYLDEYLDDVLDIFELGFNIVSSKIEAVESIFTGKGLVFTGKMQGNREAMQDNARGFGATIQSGVSSKTDYLITGANVGKSKLSKAEKFGTKILSEQEYYDLLS